MEESFITSTCATTNYFCSFIHASFQRCQAQKGIIWSDWFKVETTNSIVYFRQEILFVNLIRKILLKDFTFCDSATDVSNIEEDVSNVHLRNCIRNPNTSHRLPENSILRSVYNTQLLVKRNFDQMDNLKDSLTRCEDGEHFLQDYQVGSTALDCSLMITFQKLWDYEGK